MKTILIVDDAATVRLYHRSIAEQCGWNVIEAVNGMEALEQSHTHEVDLYLVDVNMPVMDGYSFLRALRAQDIVQRPAIMVSTEAEPDDRHQAYAAGANLYLVKPVSPDSLQKQMRLLLGEAA